MESYPSIAKVFLEVPTSFLTTYLCDRAFSSLVKYKTHKTKQASSENDMRLALSKTQPEIPNCSSKKRTTKITLIQNVLRLKVVGFYVFD